MKIHDVTIKPTPDMECNQRYINLYFASYGGSEEGAKRHFEMMQRFPEGYQYYGQLDRAYAEQRVAKDSSLIIIEGQAYDLDGRPRPENVVIVGQKIV